MYKYLLWWRYLRTRYIALASVISVMLGVATMIVVNSICGCAAGKMRPGVRLAMQHTTTPDHSITVFAGQDREATERARSYFQGHPPTSPAIAILRDGQLVYLMQRSAIETSTAPAIAQELARAFDTYCAKTTA